MGVAVKETSAQAGVTTEITSLQQANVMGHAFMFVGGFTLVFVALGVTAGLLFSSISNIIDTLLLIGGVLLLILGIHMSGVIKWLVFKLKYGSPVQRVLAFIDHRLDMLILPERRRQAGLGQSPGYIRSGVVGMTFAAGWTPCIGPLLGAIFGLSLNISQAAAPTTVLIRSGVLFFAYALGLAVPFVLGAWALSKATNSLKSLNKFIPIVEKISALLLIGIAYLLLRGSFSELNQFFVNFQPEFLYTAENSLLTAGLSLPIAFTAGLLSFLSPCVLPLVPVYIGYLTGVTAAGNNAQAA